MSDTEGSVGGSSHLYTPNSRGTNHIQIRETFKQQQNEEATRRTGRKIESEGRDFKNP